AAAFHTARNLWLAHPFHTGHAVIIGFKDLTATQSIAFKVTHLCPRRICRPHAATLLSRNGCCFMLLRRCMFLFLGFVMPFLLRHPLGLVLVHFCGSGGLTRHSWCWLCLCLRGDNAHEGDSTCAHAQRRGPLQLH